MVQTIQLNAEICHQQAGAASCARSCPVLLPLLHHQSLAPPRNLWIAILFEAAIHGSILGLELRFGTFSQSIVAGSDEMTVRDRKEALNSSSKREES